MRVIVLRCPSPTFYPVPGPLVYGRRAVARAADRGMDFEFDHWIGSSTGYFVGRLVVLNLSGVTLNAAGIAHLIAELSKRNIRVMGLEGVEPIQSPGLPPVLRGRRAVSNIETIESARGNAQLARSQAQEHRNEPNSTELTPLVGRTVADVERELILETLRHCGGNRTHAANVLGISIRTIRNKLNDYSGAQPRPRSSVVVHVD